MKLDTALSMLRRDPMTFLRNNLVVMVGHGITGVTYFYFGYQANSIGVNEAFKFSTTEASLDRSKAGIDGVISRLVQVHNVRMNKNSEDLDVSHIEPYVLDGGGPDIMVTGQVSACIIVVQQLPGGSLVVGHVQPGEGRQTATTLRQTLKLMGRFNGYGRVTHVFGLGDYHPRAHVIGVRTAGVWHLYAQVIASGSGPVTNSVQLV